MPTISPVQQTQVREAIHRASSRTGVDFDYLMAQARLESDLDPGAKARTSSATGLYQFINSTWLDTLDRHADKHGMGWAGDAISKGGHVADRGMRDQLLSLRYDADLSSLMAAELTRDNSDGLRQTLGRDPEPAELYLAHFMGLAGARSFLSVNERDPGRSAPGLMPQAASANRAIFYDGGRARSVGEVMDVIRTKVAGAMGRGDTPGAAPTGLRQEFYAAAARPRFAARGLGSAPSLPEATRRPSMAETLEATFAGTGGAGGRAATQINAAYAKFRAFDL